MAAYLPAQGGMDVRDINQEAHIGNEN